MDGLRYYVGSLLLIACAINGAEKEQKKLPSPKLKIHVDLPSKPTSKLYTSSRTFYVPLSGDTATIAAIKELFRHEIERLAQQKEQKDCSCGGPCADIRAAKLLISYKDKPLQIAFWGIKTDDTTTLAELHEAGFKIDHSVLYAQFEKSACAKASADTEKKEGA